MRIRLLKTQRRHRLQQMAGLEEKLTLRTKLKRIRRKIKKEFDLILNWHNRELKLLEILAGPEALETIISDLK